MRLWSLHPKYLDRAGLLACWREGLLAKKVLEGNTKGYKYHPQLSRFKNYCNSILSINAYLSQIYQESKRRGYNFSVSKIHYTELCGIINVTSGQILFEKEHLLNKLLIRDVEKAHLIADLKHIETNPIFKIVSGKIEKWEII